MANPQLVVRIAANVEELKKNLASGKASIEALGPSVEQLTHKWKANSDKLIQDARNITAAVDKIGVSTLTAGDSARALKTLDAAMEQLRSTGQRVPPEMQKLATELHGVTGKTSGLGEAAKKIGPMLLAAFSVGAIKAFASDLMDTADNLSKMSDKTGIGTDALQYLQAAATRGGNTLDEVTSAISKMQIGIAGEDKGMLKALKALGLSYDDIRKMKAEDQFTTIAGAIAKVVDPSDRAKLSALAFKKAGVDLAGTLAQNFDEIKKDVTVMSATTVKRLDDAGDRLQQMGDNIKSTVANWIVWVVDWTKQISNGVVITFMRIEATVLETLASMADKAQKFNIIPGIGKHIDREADALHAAAAKARAASDAMIQSVGAEMAAQKQGIEVKKVARIATLDLGEETRKVAPKMSEAQKAAEDLAKAVDAMAMQERLAAGNVTQEFIQSLGRQSTAMSEVAHNGFGNLTGKAITFTHTLPEVVKESGKVTGEVKKMKASGLDLASQAFDNMGRVAEMSGHKTTAAMLGIGKTIVDTLKSGSPVQAAIAGATALITTFADKLFKIEGRKVNDLRDDFIAAAGGLHALNVKAHEANMTLDELLRADTVKEYEAAVKHLTDAFEKQNRTLAEQQRIQGEIKSVEQQIEALRKSSIASWGDIEAAAREYGVEISKLGPAIQQIRLTEFATKALDAFEKLIGAGGDTNAVLDGMSDEFSQLVIDAKKYGLVLPENMRPVIESLMKQGKLLDAEGKAMTDIGGLKWGEKVKTQGEIIADSIKALEDTLKQLTEALQNLVPKAARDGFKDAGLSAGQLRDTLEDIFARRWKLKIDLDDPGGGGKGGQGGESNPLPGFAFGTGGRFLNFGAGTPVVLHGEERVMTRGEAADMSGVEAKLDQLLMMLPSAMARATRDAMAVAG